MEKTPTCLRRLNQYRLQNDLTYAALEDVMATAGYRVRWRSLHLALTGRLRRGPSDRTLYKIEKFLASTRERASA